MQRIIGQRVLARVARVNARNFSSAEASEAHHIETMDKWRKISYGAFPVVGLLTAYNVYAHFAHHGHHGEHHEPFAYQNIRTKPFPWQNSNCPLFDGECHEKANAARAALGK